MPNRPELEFQLPDAQGKRHAYHVTPHPYAEAAEIMKALLGAVTAPLLAVLAASGKRLTVEGVMSAIGDPGVQAAVSGAVNALPASVMVLLFRHADRDGKLLRGDALDEAFACNTWESLQAARKIVEFNGFFGPLTTWLAEQRAKAGEGAASQKPTPNGE
jgi:hypothetical protein